MSVQRFDRAAIANRAVSVLGFESDETDLFSTEALCASLRRAASFLCPTSPRRIVDAVLDAVTPLGGSVERETLSEALDALVASGDLLELRDAEERTRLLYLGPPSFVEKQPGEYLLLGIRPRAAALLDDLDADVFYENHLRSVVLDPDAAVATLTGAGLHQVSRQQWTKAPRVASPAQVIETLRDQLAADRAPGVVSDLQIIDSERPVHYYKGRWREPDNGDNGILIGRRPQAYGAPIWCAVEIEAGVPQAVVDLPVDSTVAPGWDEARRIQAAIDARNGKPQVFRTRPSSIAGTETEIDLFGPLPTWAERYLTITGRPAKAGRGALFAYSLPPAAADHAQEFLSTSLWMSPIKED